jgi:hypothetical protein
MDIEIEADD